MEIKRAGRVLAIVSVMFMAASVTLASETPQDTVSTLFELLFAIYDNDASLIPDDPNGIIALQYSEESRDQLAWAIFELIRFEMDPNSRPPEEEFLVSDKQSEIDTLMMASALESPEGGQMLLMAEWEEELTGPLGSCILEPKTYRITSLPLQIEGHVVIPAGTKFIAPYDPNHAVIEVMPGALLDTGKAAFYSEESYPAILPPVEILPEDPNILFWHNTAGIYVHRGADSKTRLENLQIVACQAGIVIDEELQYPLRNVITAGCYDGLHLYAPAAVVDCQFWFNGTVFDTMPDYFWDHLNEYLNGTLIHDPNVNSCFGVGVYINIDSEAYLYPEVTIERTVLYDGDAGLYLRGIHVDPNLPDPNAFIPKVHLVNTCLAFSYFSGIYQKEGEVTIDMHHCGFGGNWIDSNISLPFTDCVGLSYDPFYTTEEDFEKLYVDPYSELIDAGYGVATDGTGITRNWPDTGQMDIGAHFNQGVTGGFGIQSSPADFNWDGFVDEHDLALMNACMGASNDPNLLRMDFNWDSFINWPDFAVYARDRGWAADPNFSENPDPNAVRSDFNEDGFVDLGDLAVLAEWWMTPVFDEYRVCSLCNLYTAIDPNDPNAPQAINTADMDSFMAEWGRCYASDLEIRVDQSASSLSVSVDNVVPGWAVSAFLDDEPIGHWENWELSTPVFYADLTRFGPGSHRLKIVRNIDYGLEIIEQIITDPNSIGLYFADIPEHFTAHQTYEVSAYNLLNQQYSITFTDALTGQIVGATTASDEFVSINVPGSVLGNILASVSIKNLSSDKEIVRELTKPFDPNDWQQVNPRAVIICPDTHWWNGLDLFVQRKPAIIAAARAFENQGIAYCVLYKKDVTPANLQFVLGNRSLRYVYWVGHGNRSVGDPEIPRTSLSCWVNGEKVPAFSFTRQTIPSAPTLSTAAGTNYDVLGFDLNSITIDGRPMREALTKRLVVIDACSSCSTKLPDGSDRYDMAWVFGAYAYNPGWPLADHMNYIGWSIDVAAGGGIIINDDTTDRMVDFWQVLGSGNNLGLAYERIWNNSATATASASLLPTFFGPDSQNQYGKADDTFKREGLGPKEQKLENR